MRYDNIPLVSYTKGEEAVNTASHAAGLVLSVLIVIYCLLPSERAGDVFRTVCAALYCLGTTVMFLTSALYHGAKPGYKKKVLRLLDHCMIYFAVAGTATGTAPAVVATIGVFPAVLMIVCAWVGACAGLALTFFSFERTKGIQMALYIATGIVCAFCGGGAFKHLPKGALYALLVGGGLLLVGAALYSVGKKLRYIHCVFHFFIDAGLAVFYWGIVTYVY